MLNAYKSLEMPTKSLAKQKYDRDEWNLARSREDADFYTTSYSGRKIDEFLDILSSAGVCSVVDIRFSTISMYKREFSKANLQSALSTRGIGYYHYPELGIPRDIRSLIVGKNNRDMLWDWYDRYVVPNYVSFSLDRFFNGAERPIALLCLEVSPVECHRHRLALALEKKGLKSYDL